MKTVNAKQKELTRAFFKAFTPKPVLKGSQWADRYRYVAASTSPEPGRWVSSRTPYLTEILDACTDRRVEQVYIMAASQIGKSELLLTSWATTFIRSQVLCYLFSQLMKQPKPFQRSV